MKNILILLNLLLITNACDQKKALKDETTPLKFNKQIKYYPWDQPQTIDFKQAYDKSKQRGC